MGNGDHAFFTNRDLLMDILTWFTINVIATAHFRYYSSLSYPLKLCRSWLRLCNHIRIILSSQFSTQNHPMVRCQDLSIFIHDTVKELKAFYIQCLLKAGFVDILSAVRLFWALLCKHTSLILHWVFFHPPLEEWIKVKQ